MTETQSVTSAAETLTNQAAVRTDEVWKIFLQGPEEVQAVRGVTLTIARGDFVAMAGPSGSGKTTLLNLIGGLTRPSRGHVWVAGHDVAGMSGRALAHMRLQQVGFVFQAYNLLPVLTAFENAELPLLMLGMEEAERRRRVHELFERTGLTGLEDRRPGKLSGGQQQRVAIIRAVASRPALVLADEPTANLDSAQVMERARRLIRLVDGQIDSDDS
jgi:putative ABC transport system ATP-binding protein